MAAAALGGRFDLGRVLRNAFAIYDRFPVTLLPIGALITFPTAMATGWLNVHLVGPQPAVGDFAAIWRRFGLLEVVSVFASGFGWVRVGAVALCAAAAEAGDARLDHRVLVSKLLAQLPVLYLLGIVTNLATAIGLVLLVVPGVIMSLAWSLGPIVAVREEKGSLSVLGRSAELTRGHRLQLFGMFLLIEVVAGALGLIARGALGAPLLASELRTDPALIYLVQPGLQALLGPISAAITAAAYTELRTIKEGAAADLTAQTFN